MARKREVDAPPSPATKVRVLKDCEFGKPDDVVILEGAALDAAVDEGFVDATPEAVAYAESLIEPVQAEGSVEGE